MKNLKAFVWMAMGMLVLPLLVNSCSVDDDDNDAYWRTVPNALVTVKNVGDSCYLQLDDSTTLYASNMKTSPYGKKEVRALVNFSKTSQKDSRYDYVVNVNWIDSILTKPVVPTMATTKENDEKYGTDPVDIVRDWVTVAEDGYLTLRFRTFWGNTKTHYINLVSGVNPKDPYELELRHNANGDPQARVGDALVAFKLKGVLPDTGGKTVKLTIKWKSTQGDKTVTFDYGTKQSTSSTLLLKGYESSTVSRNFK